MSPFRRLLRWWRYPPATSFRLEVQGSGPSLFQVVATWGPPRPTRANVEAYVVQRVSGARPPRTPTDGMPVFDGIGDGVAQYPLLPGTYTFAIWVRYEDLHYSRRVHRTIYV